MAVPHSRELCIEDAKRALRNLMWQVCHEIRADFIKRGIERAGSSPLLQKLWDGILHFGDPFIECDKMIAQRQLERIRQSGVTNEISPFISPKTNPIKNSLRQLCNEIPSVIIQAKCGIDLSSQHFGYCSDAEERIDLEYAALESEYIRDMEAAKRAYWATQPDRGLPDRIWTVEDYHQAKEY